MPLGAPLVRQAGGGGPTFAAECHIFTHTSLWHRETHVPAYV